MLHTQHPGMGMLGFVRGSQRSGVGASRQVRNLHYGGR